MLEQQCSRTCFTSFLRATKVVKTEGVDCSKIFMKVKRREMIKSDNALFYQRSDSCSSGHRCKTKPGWLQESGLANQT